ncbi:MFS transporter [Kitasatospora sp. NBC_00458]|uniref:MFS transporter n=1 Tax=Kitasatospora sp. NBC_00458 TaxID=2903568 RepID=UPI002E16DD65
MISSARLLSRLPREYRPLFAHGPFRRLLPAFAVSDLGDGMSVVAVAWLALQLAPPGAPGLLVVAAVAAYVLPGAVGGLLLGRWLRGLPARRLIRADAWTRAVLLGCVPVAWVLGLLGPVLYLALLAGSSLLHAWGSSAKYALVAEAVPAGQRLAANALLSTSTWVATIAGPALAGALAAAVAPAWLIGLDALSFAVLAVRAGHPRGGGGGVAASGGSSDVGAGARPGGPCEACGAVGLVGSGPGGGGDVGSVDSSGAGSGPGVAGGGDVGSGGSSGVRAVAVSGPDPGAGAAVGFGGSPVVASGVGADADTGGVAVSGGSSDAGSGSGVRTGAAARPGGPSDAVPGAGPCAGAEAGPDGAPRSAPGAGPRRSGEGLRALRARPDLLALLAVTWLFNLFYGPVEVALPLFVGQDLHAGPGVLGLYWMAFGLGAALGTVAVGALRRLPVWPVLLGIVAGHGLAMLPFALHGPGWPSIAGFALAGVVYGPYSALALSLFQDRTPPAALTAVLALRSSVLLTAGPTGTALGGPLTAALGPRPVLVGTGLAMVAVAVAAAALRARARADAGGAAVRRTPRAPRPYGR